MSVRRIFMSALSLVIGLAVCYAGLHYIPTLMKPVQVVDTVAPPGSTSQLDVKRSDLKDRTVYIQNFFLRRTYLRRGQALQIHYALPAGTEVDLHVRQCRHIFIVEVFHCFPLSEQTLTITNRTVGTKILRFPGAGFYHFEETVRLPEPYADYRMIWSRI